MKSLDLNLLLTLDVLIQEGSVVGAARRLNLSTPAMSRSLARIRDAVGDPVLVRSGRGLAPTPRALELREQVRSVVEQAQAVFTAFSQDINLATLTRVFTLRANDVFVGGYGGRLREHLRRHAPRTVLRFVSEGEDDADALSGDADLYIGSSQKFGADIKVQSLFTTSFCGLARNEHPIFNGDITPQRFAACDHVSVSRRGRSQGPIDLALAEMGLARQVSLITPTFHAAIFALADSDLLLPSMPEHLIPGVKRLGLALRAFPVPVPLAPVTVVQAWPPRLDSDPAHRWLRQTIKQVCDTVS
ncbi:LysR family transcriptional regulator [Achromobacter deleyi]|uniref:LysR family transcriptional regulator n=1 Tax=Achromobacter deleyi TaxID=1353891 RepID=UPI00149290C5|nr:LysR family transcriptional regulator [Achromobacter deleyi]QVQ25447.1 LysR family transcriptional regulator [Achromobacter deleyi]UIP20990.1 LysR family transcriptional regulator [Achromobacter deleyi]